ncbi:MAG TPA: response regulator [Thermoanaerobaculia bacterium]|jgi:two-component system alkaline phosphatase synthesis response regulator PhoP
MMPPARSTILIADDEPSIRETAGYILESEGYTVLLAANGEEALSLIRSRRPAAVLLDIEMPRKNGLQVCQEVKGDPSLRSTYIILLTARGQKKDEVEGLAAGADAYLTKPFDDEEILRRLADAIGAA